MKMPLLLLSLMVTSQLQAQSFSDLFDRRSPSERCTSEISRHYQPTGDMISGCNKHTSKEANRCVEIVIETRSQMHPKSTLICSYQNSKHGVKAMEEFSAQYGLNVATQIIFSMVDSEREANCITNLLRATDLNNNHLESCLDETYEQRKQRGITTIGVSTAKRTDDENGDGVMGFIRGLF